ncbi:hypothetical protein [Kribbella sp. NPDC051718]|uniref:hypothetical protein n=1 Tax=Kribbella sp. NPDC051718 TaxID=3155168 RepID=UPI00342A0832
MRAALRLIAILLALLVGLTGCGGGDDKLPAAADATSSISGDGASGPACSPAKSPHTLVLVVGIHQNQPAPGVPDALECLLRGAVENGTRLAVVAVDGSPALMPMPSTFEISTANELRRKDDIKRALSTVVGSVRSARADSDGSDLFAGIKIAADFVRANGAADGQIVVIDSGLSDTGVIDMTRAGMLAIDPSELGDSIAADLDGLHLKGVQVTLVGFGYTRPPQEPLPAGQSEAVSTLWTKLLTTAGATVVPLPAPRTGNPPSTSFTTRPVKVVKPTPPPPPPPCARTTVVYDDASPVGFDPKSNDFRDRDAALEVLRGVAVWALGGPYRRVVVTGTTADVDTVAKRVLRSKGRAETVKKELVLLRVDPSMISTRGVGTNFPEYIDDRKPGGGLDPVLAVKNRTVRITLIETRPDCPKAGR